MTPYLKKLFKLHPECKDSWDEQLKTHPNLGRTTWTPEQIEKLDLEHENHYASCSECQDGLAVDCSDSEDHEECLNNPERACYLNGYCAAGQKTLTTWLNADHEFSWQQDFPGRFEDLG